MSYQSRRRNYRSYRERLDTHWRNYRVAIIFILIALLVLIYKNRVDWWNYLQTYFY